MTETAAAETDIYELMSRDPFGHSDQDIDAIVTHFRDKRKLFNAGNAKAGSTKPPTEAQKKKAAAKAAVGSLSDLGL